MDTELAKSWQLFYGGENHMDVSRLFYGSFEKILRKYMVPNASYEEIANALLLSPLVGAEVSDTSKQSIYNEYHIEETTIAKIRRGTRGVTKELLRDYLEPEALKNVEHHFSVGILPYIPIGKRAYFIDDLLCLIGQDDGISPQEKSYFREIATQKEFAPFLAETYIFAITGISALTGNTARHKAANLPAKNHFFCGRDTLLREIRQSYQNGMHVQGLYGMGGVGKTQIALQYAHEYMEEYKVIWWINAENKLTMQGSISDFLILQGCFAEASDARRTRAAFLEYCSSHKEWLLIYDNAEYGTPEEYETLLEYFPLDASGGNILLTTRCKSPFEHAGHREVSVWEREEAIAFLEQRSGIRDDKNAKILAEQMGFLPLALEYAAAYIRETPGVEYAGYSRKLKKYGIKVLDRKAGHQAYKRTVREAFHITLDRLLEDSAVNPVTRSAEQFLNICAFLAPDGIEIRHFSHYGKGLPEPVRTVLENELDCDELARLLTKYSLVRIEQENMSMHRLLQEILRDELTPAEEILCINYTYGVFYNIFYSMREMTVEEMRPVLASSVPHVQVILSRYIQYCRNDRQEAYDHIMVAKEYFSWTSLLLTDIKQLEPSGQAAACRRDIPILQTAVEFYGTLPGSRTVYLAYTLMLLAQANAKLGNIQTAHEQYTKALCVSDETVDGLPVNIPPQQLESVQGLYRAEAFLLASDICAAIASNEIIYEHADLLWHNYHNLIKILLKQFACFPHKADASSYRQTLLDLWIFSQQVADYTGRAFILRLDAPEEWLEERNLEFLDGFYGFFLPKEKIEVCTGIDVMGGFDILFENGNNGVSESIDDSWVTLAFDENVQSLDDMLEILVDMERTTQNQFLKHSLRSAAYVLAMKLKQENIKAFYESELRMTLDYL